MSIIINSGGTTSTSGGTAQTFNGSSSKVNDGRKYIDFAEDNFLEQQHIIVTAKEPVLQADGTFSKRKAKTKFVQPKMRADGSLVFNWGSVELSYDVETTPTEVEELRENLAQLTIQTALDLLWKGGALPD